MKNIQKISLEEINAARGENGGWTKATLARWGIGWPPPKGWKDALVAGDEIKNIAPVEKESHPYSIESDVLHDVVMAVISSGHGDILKDIETYNAYCGGRLPTVEEIVGGRPEVAIIEGGIRWDDTVYRFSVARKVRQNA